VITARVLMLVALLITVVVIGIFIQPRRASTLDFYLAGQRVGVVTNACAICGDYFSAASFLGVAAAVYVSGLDGVWYATGFAAGFIPVLLFVAAPLRRFGEFSIPDFLARRLQSSRVRLTAVTVVQLIILSYLVPQAVGSGITWELLVGSGFAGLSPYATGVLVSTTLITGLVTSAAWFDSLPADLQKVMSVEELVDVVEFMALDLIAAIQGASGVPLQRLPRVLVGRVGWNR
jgi:cation/acetate symporter